MRTSNLLKSMTIRARGRSCTRSSRSCSPRRSCRWRVRHSRRPRSRAWRRCCRCSTGCSTRRRCRACPNRRRPRPPRPRRAPGGRDAAGRARAVRYEL